MSASVLLLFAYTGVIVAVITLAGIQQPAPILAFVFWILAVFMLVLFLNAIVWVVLTIRLVGQITSLQEAKWGTPSMTAGDIKLSQEEVDREVFA